MAQGIDAGIQQELRARLHELEASRDARRSTHGVEVAFVSLCDDRAAAGRSLDQPIWPDIPERYDAFGVETFVPSLSGPPADRRPGPRSGLGELRREPRVAPADQRRRPTRPAWGSPSRS